MLLLLDLYSAMSRLKHFIALHKITFHFSVFFLIPLLTSFPPDYCNNTKKHLIKRLKSATSTGELGLQHNSASNVQRIILTHSWAVEGCKILRCWEVNTLTYKTDTGLSMGAWFARAMPTDCRPAPGKTHALVDGAMYGTLMLHLRRNEVTLASKSWDTKHDGLVQGY